MTLIKFMREDCVHTVLSCIKVRNYYSLAKQTINNKIFYKAIYIYILQGPINFLGKIFCGGGNKGKKEKVGLGLLRLVCSFL